MSKILLLSDSHSHMDDRILEFASKADQVWHAGDVGDFSVIKSLESVCKRVVAVFGNIDGTEIRKSYPENFREKILGVDIWMTHIGGYPGNYSRQIREEIHQKPPDLFISGHSHILKVMSDKKLNLLHMNPGAIGRHGFHKKRTMLSFKIDNSTIQDLFVIELGDRSSKK